MIAAMYKFLVSDFLNPLLISTETKGSGEVYGIPSLFFYSFSDRYINRFTFVGQNFIGHFSVDLFLIIMAGPVMYRSTCHVY